VYTKLNCANNKIKKTIDKAVYQWLKLKKMNKNADWDIENNKY